MAPARQCLSVSMKEPLQVWAVDLSDDAKAVLLLNLENTTRTIVASWASLGLGDKQPRAVRDVLRREDMGEMASSVAAVVSPHGARLFRITHNKATGQREE